MIPAELAIRRFPVPCSLFTFPGPIRIPDALFPVPGSIRGGALHGALPGTEKKKNRDPGTGNWEEQSDRGM
jgi:hypothetical protein